MMNRRQKIVQEQFIDDEEKVITRLKSVYSQSLKDINGKVKELDSSIEMLQKAYDSIDGDTIGDLAAAVLGKKAQAMTPAQAQETIKSRIQSKVYQKKYQSALKKQVDTIFDKMQDKEFKLVSDYLDECYENGFIGAMFDLQGQGIPLAMPLDQEAMVRAVQLDSKISHGLYTRLGEDVSLLKKKITAQVSRGISTGMSYQQVAQQLAGYTNIGFNNAVRIARTEGHRIQVQSAMDACYKAKEKGADVIKQWDSTLDGATRESHAQVDGEIRELDEKFSNGLMFPGDPAGGAAEVINCRCALLQRAKWALDEEELEELKKRAEYFGLDKTDSFEEYKKKYLKAAEEEKNGNPFDLYSFTDEQSKAIEWYVSGEGQYINQYHRGRVGSDFGELSDDEKKFSALLDEATRRDVPGNVNSLYRSVDAKAIFGDIDEGDWYDIEGAIMYNDEYSKKKVQGLIDRTKGKTITEKGFMSTTKSLDVAEEWGDFTGSSMPVTLEFDDIPKGLKGADLKHFDIDGDEQFEVLLARNTKYKITDIYAKNGQVHVKAKFIVDDVDDAAEVVTKNAVYNSKKISSQFKLTDAMNEYDYFDEEQEMFRLSAIQEMSGVDNAQARKYLDALCGQRDDYIRASNAGSEYETSWFYGADGKIRSATSGEYFDKAETIHDYIVRSPKYEGEIYRGLSLNEGQIKEFSKGGIFEENGLLSSWTSSMDVADMFAHGRSEELGLTPVVIKTKNPQYGTPVSHLSIFGQEEQEVLVSNLEKSQYTIGDITEKDGVVIIELLG